MANNVSKQSPSVYIGPGGYIKVLVSCTPENAVVEVGIINEQGYVNYVSGSNYICHTFSDIPFGNYRVYVLNESGAEVNVEGCYIVK